MAASGGVRAFLAVLFDWRGTLVVESESLPPVFANDVGVVLRRLHGAGVRLGVVSDADVDIRPAFLAQRNPDGRSWADLIEVWVLSSEMGLAKPDPAVFQLAIDRFGFPADRILMVGDRAALDGAAVDSGMTTLLLPPLRDPGQLRLRHVLSLVGV